MILKCPKEISVHYFSYTFMCYRSRELVKNKEMSRITLKYLVTRWRCCFEYEAIASISLRDLLKYFENTSYCLKDLRSQKLLKRSIHNWCYLLDTIFEGFFFFNKICEISNLKHPALNLDILILFNTLREKISKQTYFRP